MVPRATGLSISAIALAFLAACDGASSSPADASPGGEPSAPANPYLGTWEMEEEITESCPPGIPDFGEGFSSGTVRISAGRGAALVYDIEGYCVLDLDLKDDSAIVRPNQPCTSDPMVGSVFEWGTLTVNGDTAHLAAGGTQWDPYRGVYYPCMFTVSETLRRTR